MASLTLYNYYRSSTSYRVRIALHFKKLDFEYKPVHLLNDGGQHRTAEYKALNPLGEVPTLVHQGQSIAQSMAIISYLEDVFPQNPLFPSDPIRRAQVRQFCENINAFMHPLGNLKVTQYLEKTFGYDQPKKNQWIAHWNLRGYEALERMLEKNAGTYCFGDSITAADLFLIPQMFASTRYEVPLAAFPHCLRVNDNCVKLEAFKKAHPSVQPDFS